MEKDEFRNLHTMLPPFLQQHSAMVALYSELLAQEAIKSNIYKNDLYFSADMIHHIQPAAYYHDIGKVCISNTL